MSRCPILMYHWFRAGGAASASRSPQLEITPELFERQLAALERTGYRSLPLRCAVEPGASNGRGRPIVLTFDDGTLDFWEHARPALERHGFTATLFVVAGRVGGRSSWDRELGEPERPLMDWEQIRELHRAGHEIGSHTDTHRPLTGLGDDDARVELERSRATIAERIGDAPAFVAYPRGFFTERDQRLAREAGYAGACAVILCWGDLWRSERYGLRRMTVKGDESMLRFRLRLWLSGIVRHRAVGAES